MTKCSVCSNNSLNNKNLDNEQAKCILHCKKTDKNNWYILNNNTKTWNQKKLIIFWKYFNKQDYSNPKTFNSLIPPLPKYKYQTEHSINIEYSTILDTLEIYKTNELSILDTEVNGNITVHNSSTNSSRLFFSDNIHSGDIIVLQGNSENINLHNIQANSIKLGKEEKDNFPNNYQSIEITGDNTHIRCFDICNTYIHNTFTMNNIKVDKFNCLNTIFNKKTEIKETIFSISSYFENTKFNGLCDFYKTEFNDSQFKKTTFDDIVVFTESKFNKDVNFQYTTFSKLALFRKTKFENSVNFTDSIFREEANFLDMMAKVKNRETARIIKNSFEQQNNIIEANKFYALEMKKREEELKDKNNQDYDLKDWIIFLFHKISSNHSQDWLLSLFWIINITLLITFLQFEIAEERIVFYFLSITIIGMILLFIGSLFISEVNNLYKSISILIFSVIHYFIYGLLTHDFILCYVVNNINPFSIMTGDDTLTTGIFIYKMIIAYLIYQFIISVRQNTRRN